MKLNYLILLTFIFSCSQTQEKKDSISDNDTITTASGLQYYYLKRGDGPMVQKGASVDTKLSLMVNDSVVWTSYEDEDSVFSFIVGVSGVIKGFEEMAFLMREGDNVVAILPDSLAYGDRGAGDDIPPNATLVYDRYEMVRVSEPKKMLGDTLYPILENDSYEAMMNAYYAILNSSLKEEYHINEKGDLYNRLMKNERYQDLELLAREFESQANSINEKQTTWYYQLLAMEQQGDTSRFIQRVNEIIELDPEEAYWKEALQRMQSPTE